MCETTKKYSWVGKDLTKSPEKKCFEENGALQNAKKHRTTKNWVEEEYQIPYKNFFFFKGH